MHTLTQLARKGHAHYAQAGCVTGLAPASRALCVISQPSPVVSRIVLRHKAVSQPFCRRPCHDTNFVSQHRPLPRSMSRALHRVTALLHRVAGRWAPYRSHIMTQKPPLTTIQFLYRDSLANLAPRVRTVGCVVGFC